MKKISVLITIIFLVTIFCSCGKLPNGEATQPETTKNIEGEQSTTKEDENIETTETENESESKNQSEFEMETETETEELQDVFSYPTAYFFEGGSGVSDMKVPIPRIIRTEDEFKAYIEKATERQPQFVSKAEVQAAIQRFDEAFWENYDVVMVNIVAGSIHHRYEVISMTREKPDNECVTTADQADSDWFINIRNVYFGAASPALKEWEFWVEIPNGSVKEDEALGLAVWKYSTIN